MRIALFGAREECITSLRDAGHDVLLVMPPSGRRARIRRFCGFGCDIEKAAFAAGFRVVSYSEGPRFASALRAFRPDLICTAIFARRIPLAIRELAGKGAINLHASMLPRHRGANPIFWTYYHDDREIGWTAHRTIDRFDAGPIILQESMAVPRSYPSLQLGADLRTKLGPFLLKAIAAVEAGAPEVPQDEGLATRAPRVDLENLSIPLDRWDVERTWHFLAGWAGRFRQPLRDDRGEPVPYRCVTGFERGPALPAGMVTRSGEDWDLHCIGGTVRLRR